ncbi:unnamed protein product [marine sediment metagenome]|uniref:Uncharacterized protein n=1 Tax=marine sediment metagenome TaxID=412755 RepID=X0X764_9ZZZZ
MAKRQNKKVFRLLRALALELKDLPFETHKRIDAIVNDKHDGYDYNWVGIVDWWRNKVYG